MRPTRLIALVLTTVLLIVGIAVLLRRRAYVDGPPDDPKVQAAAAADYVKFCAVCHGVDGRTVEGSIAPNLASDDLLALASDDFLRAAIVHGRPGREGIGAKGVKMQAYGNGATPLDDERIDAIVRHVRMWQRAEPVPLDDDYRAAGDVAVGEAVYTRECSSCHGAGGWTDEAPRLAGAVFQAAASDDFIRQTIRRGRAGTAMRPLALSPSEEDALIAYIRTFSPTPPK